MFIDIEHYLEFYKFIESNIIYLKEYEKVTENINMSELVLFVINNDDIMSKLKAIDIMRQFNDYFIDKGLKFSIHSGE